MSLEVHVLLGPTGFNCPPVEHGAHVVRLGSTRGGLPNGGRNVSLHVVGEPMSIGVRVLNGERGHAKRNAGALRHSLELKRKVADAMELSDVRKISICRHEVGEALSVELDHLILISFEEGSPKLLQLYESRLQSEVDYLVDACDAGAAVGPVGVHARHA